MERITDDYDLAVALAHALRDAHAAGNADHERDLAVTLAQTTNVLALTADPDETTAATPTHKNGHPDEALIHQLLHR
ncbi:MAG: hypothetical protein L0G94_04105 [Brachybacterium sp.]|uniref:hypothetical protein n=1 Tax=Brachybacterium sp. TaxID=1891286 RepID=UPI00264760AB|nr:hypothetical protein [Brachybacterium sp.]MDN5685853.1 hypothetical protein [Brachybacterium sp.]